MNSFRRLLSKKRHLAALAGAAIAAALLALWLYRAPAAEHFAKRYLRENGFADPAFSIEALEPGHAKITAIRLESELGRLEADSVRIDYSLRELWKQKRIQTLVIEGARVSLDLAQLLPLDESAESELTLQESLQQLDLASLFPLPFDSIQLVDSSLTIAYRDLRETISLDAKIESDANIATATLNLNNQENTLKLTASLATGQPSTLVANFQSPTPTATFDRLAPGWRTQLPDITNLSLGALQGQASLSLPPNSDTAPHLDLSFQADALAANYDKLRLDQVSLSARFSTSDFTTATGSLQATPRELAWDTFALESGKQIEFALAISDTLEMQYETKSPLSWDYDNAFAQGSAHSSGTISFAHEFPLLNGELEALSTFVSEYQLQPFNATFSGTPEQLSFETTPIALAGQTDPAVGSGSGAIQIPEDETLPIHFTFAAPLHPNATGMFPEAWTVDAFDLELASDLTDSETTTRAKLSSRAERPLLQLDEARSLAGTLVLDLKLVESEAESTYEAAVNLSASNISLQLPEAQGDGISINGKLAFQPIPVSLFENDLGPEAIAELLPKLSGELQWQANRLTGSGATAQWSGGSLKLQPDADRLALSSSTSMGILDVDTIRLEQVYLEQALSGTLAQLSGKTSLQAQLDGVPLEIELDHTIADPLQQPSIRGDYRLAPTTFVHSGLLARAVPAAKGASFSARIAANGQFDASADDVDASLLLSVTQASLSHPPSQLSASGISAHITLDSLTRLDSADSASTVSVETLTAGDLTASSAAVQFKIQNGERLLLDEAALRLFGGKASLGSFALPLDGSDFEGRIFLERLSLAEISSYAEAFDGSMEGRISGYLPFAYENGRFELKRGDLLLPPGETAKFSYDAEGLLTADEGVEPAEKPGLSDRVLKFLGIKPERIVEQALSDVTVETFVAELFPEGDPNTPLRIRLGGTAHSDQADIPVVITVRVHGTLSELYNFLIRLNSL